MPLPYFNSRGDLPEGLHPATISEVILRFGSGTSQRQAVTSRLLRIHDLVKSTGKLKRFIVFGSYVTDEPEPNDIDIFLVMAEGFNIDDYTDDTCDIFRHGQAQVEFGASIFWVGQGTSLTSIDDLIAVWQMKRDQTKRGIVEVIL